ncbi:porin [Marivibrio halodurans]|uniref:Porin n=1 Tax=Marivibrio halodurans TaxID=2039722 RepID=A0A8J7S1H2_9PROT|nr:porin [Marivibrio halodurans]MBP5858145.1 porin [Marivibrio halodurans]
MKKTLLGASALVGIASLSAAPAVAAEAPEISFSGALGYEAVLHDGDMQAAGTGFNITGNEQQSELIWSATGVADNGLEYGAEVQWRWLGGGSAAGGFDEAFMDFSGGFGRAFVGFEDGITDLVAGTAGHSLQVGTWGTDGNNALRHVNFLGLNTKLHYYQSHAALSGDANKIGYSTPSFGGFQAGVSFTPEGNAGQAAGVNNGSLQNNLEVAAGYSNTFGDVSLTVDGAYGIGQDNSIPTVGGDRADVKSYQLGAMIGFAGFSVAGSFLDNDDSSCPDLTPNCDAGDGWNVGAGYSFGPAGVSVMWQEAEDDTDGNGFSDESEIFHAGVSYTIAEGLSTYANYYNFSVENEAGGGAGVATSNDADVLILGSRITF